MASENVRDRLIHVMIRDLELTLNPEEVQSTSRLDDLFGVDSVTIIELIIGIEKEFGISMPTENLSVEIFQNLETLTDYVQKLTCDETPT